MTDPETKPAKPTRTAAARVKDPKHRKAMRHAAEGPDVKLATIGPDDVVALIDYVDELENSLAEIQEALQG